MYDMKTFQFGWGAHDDPEDGLCIMEAVAYLAGEKHSDQPRCASLVITGLAIEINDNCGDELRNRLLRDLPWRIIGTRACRRIEVQRIRMLSAWLAPRVKRALEQHRRFGLTREFYDDLIQSTGIILTALQGDHPRQKYLTHVRAVDHILDAIGPDTPLDDFCKHLSGAIRSWPSYKDVAAALLDAWGWILGTYPAEPNPACPGDTIPVQSLVFVEEVQSAVDLLDRMIRLTEPQERACQVSQCVQA